MAPPQVLLFSNFSICASNLNGWDTVPERPGYKGKLLPRRHYAFQMFRRHHLSVVGIVEHHFHSVGEVQSVLIDSWV